MTIEDINHALGEDYAFDKFVEVAGGIGVHFTYTGQNAEPSKTVVIANVPEEDITVE